MDERLKDVIIEALAEYAIDQKSEREAIYNLYLKAIIKEEESKNVLPG